MNRLKALLIIAFFTLPLSASAQGASIAFGNVKQDTSGPVEVAADNMSINQNTGSATLTGNVLVGQGAMRLSANVVNVVYNADRSQISELKASGKVTLVSGQDAAEAASATYNINTGIITLSGNVLLVQGATAITADKMRVDTKSGTARMEGRVKTVLNVKQ
ncbi:lipopolysaccharide transport periplasmic protein LptA [Lentibacter algarum]|uniref:LptA/OstA family protein n=1 Tax=Lentibacter algarum TaxID=576131 RepID=UPI001C06B988|nr:LptA/OstA family protein [Lentibacter algarum]MBU2981046.1 lipopolysaccharide transport periplasmic protein LptA [Lentibacter algarum]